MLLPPPQLLRYHTCVEPRAFGTKSWPKLGEVDSCRTRLADPADPESRQLLAVSGNCVHRLFLGGGMAWPALRCARSGPCQPACGSPLHWPTPTDGKPPSSPPQPPSQQIYRDADGDAQVEGLESDAELNQNKMNLR